MSGEKHKQTAWAIKCERDGNVLGFTEHEGGAPETFEREEYAESEAQDWRVSDPKCTYTVCRVTVEEV